MALTMFMLPFGYHYDAWRLPHSRSDEVARFSFIRDMALAAEEAKLHAVFFADSNDPKGLQISDTRSATVYEPVSTIGALSAVTSRIGMIGTASTTYSQPYSVARQFAGLDLLSDGRVGWNVVTSFGAAANFSMDKLPPPEYRYRRGAEFVEVVKKLWDSWDDDALVNDRERGLWADPERLHEIDHVGEFFSVKGPLNMPRPPQGHPVIVQAGQSSHGIEFGAAIADAIYTVQPDLEKSIEFYADIKSRVQANGRDPEKVKVLPGIMPILGETRADAEALSQELADAIRMDAGRRTVSRVLDVDVSDLELTDFIPPERMIDNPERMERWRLFRDLALEKNLGDLTVHIARSMGHRWMVGTPEEVADSLIEWFDRRACDGFNLNPPSIPVAMRRMFDLLVPLLQERGYFQHDYRGDTFRERLGVEVNPRAYRR
ncbi:LLM class flavin-dependent oxidoreductase [Microbacterium sp. zg.B185]|nr:LLM class flavin-dependent oxidoreductase [Microbacterium sp. zg.B185]MCR2808415.1 LLM class flavin-dependent oxidoreductase [Microbacterium sp. zg.B185]